MGKKVFVFAVIAGATIVANMRYITATIDQIHDRMTDWNPSPDY